MEIAIGGVLAAFLAAANAMATRVVLRDELSHRRQKVAQALFVWLVPVVGAIVVFAVHRRPEPPSRRYYEPPEPDEDVALARKPGHPVARLSDDD